MKNLLTLLLLVLLSFSVQSQSLIGAWETYSTDENGDSLRHVVIFADGFQVATIFHASTGRFIHTNGGSWKLDGDMMTEKVEFHTDNADLVGQEVSFRIRVSDDVLEIVDKKMKWRKIDDGTPGNLKGAWLMSGRIRDGELSTRDTSRPRKTMKVLSGTRFQWIAYNIETKKFMGSGGGTYTTIDGEYTENIEFFSRDNAKAGLSLTFNYELIDGKWHHSGLSSKGAPIHEIWSVRTK